MNLEAKSSRGFTLIELMVVLVIAGILFFVALPAYQDSILKANRNVARGVLMDVVSRQEQFFINNKAYSTTLDALGYDVNGSDQFFIDDEAENQDTSANAIYRIEIIAATTLGYSATPINRQSNDARCNVLTIEQTALKGATGSLGLDGCW